MWGQESAVSGRRNIRTDCGKFETEFPQTATTFPTEQIMGAEKFNFAAKFS